MSFPWDNREPRSSTATCHRSRERNSGSNHSSTSTKSLTYRNLPIDPSIPLLPIGHFMSIPKRPGRRIRQTPLDSFPSKSYGDAIIQKSNNTVRLFFQNVHGLSSSLGSEDYKYFLNSLQSLHVDVAGLAETNTCWQHSHLRDDFNTVVRRFHKQSKTVFGSSSKDVDPIPPSETYQAGGTITLVVGSLVSRAHGQYISDPTGLGRWSGITFSGTEAQKLTVITAYRVCSGSIRSVPLGSSFAREYNYFHLSTKQSVNPRRFFLRDLQHQVLQLQEQGHAIIVMLDANSTLQSDTHFVDFLDHCTLFDLHANDPAESTYIGAVSRRIDFILGCHHARQFLERSGTLAYNEGPQSDHRGLYVDIKLDFFQRFSAIPTHSSRAVHTGNPELVDRYNGKVLEYYTAHSMVERINELHKNYQSMSRDDIRARLIGWDNDKGRAMKSAENLLKRPPKKCRWSPTLRNRAFTRLYWKLRLREIQDGKNYSATFTRWQSQLRQHDKNFFFPFLNEELPLEEVRAQFNKASSAFYKCQVEATPMRMKCYEDLIAQYETDNNPATMTASRHKATIVRRTIDGETVRNKFREIRRTVKPFTASSLSKILVPSGSSALDQDEDKALSAYHILQNRNPSDVIWDTVIDRSQMEAHLLKYNRESFRAASESPFGNGLLYDAITFSGLSLASDKILEGLPPCEWSHEDKALREFLASFTIPPLVHEKGYITTAISHDDVRKGFQSWRETTSTSPSGRHLGLYKSEIQHPVLLDCFVKFMNISIGSGISIPRWSQAVNVLIEKDVGRPRINRLRIVHLFEADFNFFLKLQWGHRLVRRALSLDLLHHGQHGSIPGRTSLDPVMLTQLSSDLCRVLKHDYARFDNDASSCYDRIIVGLGMLAARKCGMPKHAIRTHADALQFMKYTVKTVHGISEENYHGTTFSPLFGTGQGSGASPAVWLSLVVILLQTLDRLIPDRVNFSSLSGDMIHTRLSDAFVDDTSLSFTSSSDSNDIDDLIARLEKVAQTWEHLLHLSGGKLNLAKCSWFIVRWEWTKGRPVIRPIAATDREVRIHHGEETHNSSIIKRTKPEESTRMLGVFMNPLGDFGYHLKQMKKKADIFATRIMSPRLSAADVRIFHRTTYVPSMRYGLAAVALDEEELSTVQSRIIPAILKKLNVQSTISTAIRHGPRELGGLDLYDLRTEVGIESLKFFRDAIYSASENGKMLRLNLQYSQLEAGIGDDLLQCPNIHLSYLTPTWILSLRQFLSLHNMSVTVSDSYRIPLRGHSDQYIMQEPHLARYSTAQQRDINLVRIFLQVTTLADLTDCSNPKAIKLSFLDGLRPSGFVVNQQWPRQQTPSKQQIRLWKGYIKSSFLRYIPYWKTVPVPHPPPNTSQTQHSSPSTFENLQDYLSSLPQSHRRMLDSLDQISTDLQVWKSFRGRKRLYVATDGGLLKNQGTHGWVISNGSNVLFRCAGPVDGPFDTASSTRCELFGYASALLFIDHLSRFWGLRHKPKFTWICDSKAAMSRVRHFATRRPSRRMPSDADLISIIRTHLASIKRKFKHYWVKGHQDSSSKPRTLSVPATLNIAADSLASGYRTTGSLTSRQGCDHVPSQQCSISINNQRLTGQFDECIRYHVNGYHLRRYMQDKNGWSDDVWNMIDLQLFIKHYCRLSSRHQITRTKFVHDQLPLGDRRFRQAQVKDPMLSLCPCCKVVVENSEHLLRCPSTPQRYSHVAQLKAAIRTKDIHPVRYVIAAGITHWLEHGESVSFNPSLSEYDSEVAPLLQAAIQSQEAIGWGNAFKGFFSTLWSTIASQEFHTPTHVNSASGDARLRSIIEATHNFSRSIWLSRNSALHDQADDDVKQIRDTEIAEIRLYHSMPHLLLPRDQHYCSRSLDKLISGSVSNRRRWLRIVKQSMDAYRKESSQQTLLTSFFPRHMS